MTDQECIIIALRDATEIIGDYLEPGPRDAEETINRLIAVLDTQEPAAALERVEGTAGGEIECRRAGAMLTGLFKTTDQSVQVEYDGVSIPIPRSTYENSGYKPDFDKLPLEDEYRAAQEKLRQEALKARSARQREPAKQPSLG